MGPSHHIHLACMNADSLDSNIEFYIILERMHLICKKNKCHSFACHMYLVGGLLENEYF